MTIRLDNVTQAKVRLGQMDKMDGYIMDRLDG